MIGHLMEVLYATAHRLDAIDALLANKVDSEIGIDVIRRIVEDARTDVSKVLEAELDGPRGDEVSQ